MIISLVPHEVCILMPDGSLFRIKPSGDLARVREIRRSFDLEGIPCVHFSYGPIEGLPDPQPNVYYLVSSKVFIAASDRSDLLRVDTGPGCIRDSQGRTQAVSNLAC